MPKLPAITDPAEYAAIMHQTLGANDETTPEEYLQRVFRALSPPFGASPPRPGTLMEWKSHTVTAHVSRGRKFFALILKNIRKEICAAGKLTIAKEVTPLSLCTAVAIEVGKVMAISSTILISAIAALLYFIFRVIKNSFCEWTDDQVIDAFNGAPTSPKTKAVSKKKF